MFAYKNKEKFIIKDGRYHPLFSTIKMNPLKNYRRETEKIK
jgi:hypothetical protein